MAFYPPDQLPPMKVANNKSTFVTKQTQQLSLLLSALACMILASIGVGFLGGGLVWLTVIPIGLALAWHLPKLYSKQYSEEQVFW